MLPNALTSNAASPASAAALPAEAIVGETHRIAARLPANWLPCDGRALSPNGYRDLFNVLGYSSGKRGDAFLLPRMPGYAIAVHGVVPTSPAVINAVFAKRSLSS